MTVSKYNVGGYGYYVMIDHGNGLATLYGHCSKLLAKVGQTVQAGDIIALLSLIHIYEATAVGASASAAA